MEPKRGGRHVRDELYDQPVTQYARSPRTCKGDDRGPPHRDRPPVSC